ncbi:MAG TPA: DUF294 nucleotidyltransferase-like domain-containing protein [Verrucomicrobiota bacterium]|nr:DUF294 nucleotidyltransferase-like domain-containing protein [Verrucomicrobiota bacterium]HNU50229.1 DUF294 nucleotidyltransferase-like domain-containing protein [Verrucomicrobiota bacterium]
MAPSLDSYRKRLKQEELRIRIAHRNGHSGRCVTALRSRMMDDLLRQLWSEVTREMPGWPKPGSDPMACLAVGGYGRCELNPRSDVDLAFVHPEGSPELIRQVENAVVRMTDTLNALGIDLGARSTWSFAEAVRLANRDMKTKTSLLQCRFLAGNPAHFATLAGEFDVHCVRGHAETYIARRLEDQAKRHQGHGMTVALLQPNIKNGCGGLRDYHNLIWVSYFKTGARSIADLVQKNVLTPGEARQLERAYDFLLRVRNEMHYLSRTKACSDLLTAPLQEEIARRWHYPQAASEKRAEAFMKDYYLHARCIYLLSETVAERLAIPSPTRFARLPGLRGFAPSDASDSIMPGFHRRGSSLEPNDVGVFDQDPAAMMRVFECIQCHRLGLGPDLRQLIRRRLTLIRRDFLAAEEPRQIFQRLLARPGHVGRVLRLMHEVDFLGRYLPEFGRITCLLQHDFLLRYTVDEHSLVCLEKLDALAANPTPRNQRYRRLLLQSPDPFVLYLALLLHDTGRARRNRFAHEASGLSAEKVAARLCLTPHRRRLLNFLIRHQHALLHTAQHCNLEDPKTAAAFAELVGSRQTLDSLTLLTWADNQASGDSEWSDWRDVLVWELHESTTACLAGTRSPIAPANPAAALRDRVAPHVPPDRQDQCDAHWAGMPDRYFQTQSQSAILDHLQLFHGFLAARAQEDSLALAPALQARIRPEQGHLEIAFCGWDRPAFLTRIAGALAAARLNILTLDAYPRSDNLALVLVRATSQAGRTPRDTTPAAAALDWLRKALAVPPLDLDPLLEHARRDARHPAPSDRTFPPQVLVSADAHPEFTLLEIRAPDRLGLLYDLLKTLDGLDVRIALSRVSTDKGAACDSFYLAGPDGRRLPPGQRLDTLQRAVAASLARPR